MSRPVLSAVVATARGGVIGREGDLPWRVPSDLKWFRRVTMGKPVIMGRKTFRSIGRALPGRLNIVMTRDPDFREEGVAAAGSVEAAIAAAGDAQEVCVIGGAEVYAAFFDRLDRILATEIDADLEGDARFPPIDEAVWARRPVEGPAPDPRDEHAARYVELTRRTSAKSG